MRLRPSGLPKNRGRPGSRMGKAPAAGGAADRSRSSTSSGATPPTERKRRVPAMRQGPGCGFRKEAPPIRYPQRYPVGVSRRNFKQ
jgi:hypothetical protein